MKPVFTISFGTIVVAALLISNTASGGGQAGSLVRLQTGTPGVAQTGHLNVSGTATAGQFVGGGSGLTSVNADLLDGLNSTAFLQSLPNPLAIDGVVADTAVIKGVNTSSNGYGLIGEANALSGTNYGVRGSIQGSSGSGVHGRANSPTGLTYAVSASNASNGGRGVNGYASSPSGQTYGGYFQSASNAGRGLFAWASSNTGSTYGLQALANSPNAIAIYGDSSSTTGFTFGGYFVSRSPDGQAVHGAATASSGLTYGVVGEVNSASGYGVYFLGRLAGSGTKLFRIDHPLDPLNKYLLHYCAEGPQPMNAYSGTVITDDKGYATVELPDYYESINKDPRIQLTVLDESDSTEFVLVKAVSRPEKGEFRVRTSQPGITVFWRVDAVRNDAFVQKHGAPVEEIKTGSEKGRYQQPWLYKN
ncbi:MAG TPA: hypothetical protein PKA27_00335 [Fimbriimonadaceae bacterium]|nr:hypothetical protein [Fimbriimonadaceae bacterium]